MFALLVSFRLRQDASESEFLSLTGEAGRVFLQRQSGFLGRELFQTKEGTWRGLLKWADEQSCREAGRLWGEHDLATAIGALTDATSLVMEELVLRHEDEPVDSMP